MNRKLNVLIRFGAWILLLGLVAAPEGFSQCESWEAHPEGVTVAKQQHTMYRSRFNAKSYKEAFPFWQKIFVHVKSPKEAPRRHFKDGIKMYQEFMKVEEDDARKKEMLDTMIQLYDQLAACTGEKSQDRAFQAYYMHRFRASPDATVKVIEKAIELGGNETHNVVFSSYASLSAYLYQMGAEGYDAAYMRKVYTTLKEIADYHETNQTDQAEKYKEKWAKVVAVYKGKGRERVLEDEVFDCDYFVADLKPKFEADKRNQEQNDAILAQIGKKCGQDNQFYQDVWAVQKEILDSIRIAQWDSLFKVANHYEKGQLLQGSAANADDKAEKDSLMGEAWKWYTKAVEEERATIPQEELATLIYRVAYQYFNKKSFSKARSLCYEAAKAKPGWGDPYILIGLMYASSGKLCGPGTGWDSQVVVWAAIDKWKKAKSIDPGVASEANKYINQYEAFMPTNGVIFQKGYKEGQSYKVGCWINETTTVRGVSE